MIPYRRLKKTIAIESPGTAWLTCLYNNKKYLDFYERLNLVEQFAKINDARKKTTVANSFRYTVNMD